MIDIYKFFRYTLVGGTVFILQFAVLATLVESGVLSPLIASAVAFVVALIASFYLQRRFTFQKIGAERIGKEFLWTISLSLFNLGFNTLTIYILLSFNLHYLLAQIIATGMIVSYSYIVYHYIFTS